jgi:hypothetical protein
MEEEPSGKKSRSPRCRWESSTCNRVGDESPLHRQSGAASGVRVGEKESQPGVLVREHCRCIRITRVVAGAQWRTEASMSTCARLSLS